MRIVGADGFLDGGTVYVDIEERGTLTRFQLDYSLPWDGRPRHISVSADGEMRQLAIESDDEKDVCSNLRGLLENEYGADAVDDALRTSHARQAAWDDHRARRASQEWFLVSHDGYNDPHPLPFDHFWLHVFDFVEKAYREGKYE